MKNETLEKNYKKYNSWEKSNNDSHWVTIGWPW